MSQSWHSLPLPVSAIQAEPTVWQRPHVFTLWHKSFFNPLLLLTLYCICGDPPLILSTLKTPLGTFMCKYFSAYFLLICVHRNGICPVIILFNGLWGKQFSTAADELCISTSNDRVSPMTLHHNICHIFLCPLG